MNAKPGPSRLAAALLCGLALGPAPAALAQQAPVSVMNGDVLDPSDPPDTKFELAPGLRFGASVELAGEASRDLDLNRDQDDRIEVVEPEVELALSYEPGPNWLYFLNFEATREYALREPEPEDRRFELALDQAYVLAKGLAGGRLMLQAGRQKFKDERRWLFDENLDGLRVFYRLDRVLLEASASRFNWLRRDLLHRAEDDRERINNYLLSGKMALSEEAILTAYALLRDDRAEGGESPLFLGLHSSGDASDALEYWIELAYQRGRAAGRKIRAYAADFGATYEFDLPLKPSLTLGYAVGSGDANPADGVDRNFRQTGLQDNEVRFNGVARFQYYGELFDPELSNLRVFTAGVGIRPGKRSSIDLVYHRYAQHRAADSLRDTSLDASPSGLSRALGWEADLVFGYRQREGQRLTGLWTIGYFEPGAAFGAEARKAVFTRFEVEFEF